MASSHRVHYIADSKNSKVEQGIVERDIRSGVDWHFDSEEDKVEVSINTVNIHFSFGDRDCFDAFFDDDENPLFPVIMGLGLGEDEEITHRSMDEYMRVILGSAEKKPTESEKFIESEKEPIEKDQIERTLPLEDCSIITKAEEEEEKKAASSDHKLAQIDRSPSYVITKEEEAQEEEMAASSEKKLAEEDRKSSFAEKEKDQSSPINKTLPNELQIPDTGYEVEEDEQKNPGQRQKFSEEEEFSNDLSSRGSARNIHRTTGFFDKPRASPKKQLTFTEESHCLDFGML